jgi:hypothetical protein
MMTIREVLQPPVPQITRLWLILVTFTASNVALAQQQVEVQVSTVEIVDFEFDWGRDGVYCSTCNQGAGNARLTFTDRRGG